MGNGTDVTDRLDDIVQNEIPIPDDIGEIERLLYPDPEPEKPAKEEDTKPESEAKPEEGDQPGADPDKTTDQKSAAEKGDKPGEEVKASAEEQAKPEEGKGPPQAVLRATREALHKTEAELAAEREAREAEKQRIADLERELQQIKAKATDGKDDLQRKADEATGGKAGKLDLLDKSKLAALRRELDDDVVDVLEKLVERNNDLTTRIETLSETNARLAAESESRAKATVQDDIDSVPLLAVLQVTKSKEADDLWARANSYERAVRADPDFQGVSRSEVLQEVGKRLERHLGAAGVEKWTGKAPETSSNPREKIIEDKLRRARDSAHPTSLSDLPAGSPAAQTEQERLEAMSAFDLESAMNRAIEAGPDALDAFITRMATLER